MKSLFMIVFLLILSQAKNFASYLEESRETDMVSFLRPSPFEIPELLRLILCESGLDDLKDLKAASQVSKLWRDVVASKLNQAKLRFYGYSLTPPLPYENLSKTWSLITRRSSMGILSDPLLGIGKQKIFEEIYERAFYFFGDKRPAIICFVASLGYEPARKSHLMGLLYGMSGFNKNNDQFKEILFQYIKAGSVVAREILLEGQTFGIYGFERRAGVSQIVSAG